MSGAGMSNGEGSFEVQATIDAIDRAITDERSIKDKGKPVSLVDLG
jgi:hypothetical protein